MELKPIWPATAGGRFHPNGEDSRSKRHLIQASLAMSLVRGAAPGTVARAKGLSAFPGLPLWYIRGEFTKEKTAMPIVEQVEKDLHAALKAREVLRLSVLRMMKAALMNKKIELGKPLEDAESFAVLRTLVKQRRDSVEQFRKGGRNDLADKEEAEIKIIETYVPAAVSEEEIDAAVTTAIAETGAKDLGKVMKVAMAKLAGRNVDGKRVNEKVR